MWRVECVGRGDPEGRKSAGVSPWIRGKGANIEAIVTIRKEWDNRNSPAGPWILLLICAINQWPHSTQTSWPLPKDQLVPNLATCSSFTSDKEKQQQYLQDPTANGAHEDTKDWLGKHTPHAKVSCTRLPPLLFPLLEAAQENLENDPSPGSPELCLPTPAHARRRTEQVGRTLFLRCPYIHFHCNLSLTFFSSTSLPNVTQENHALFRNQKKAPNYGYTLKSSARGTRS